MRFVTTTLAVLSLAASGFAADPASVEFFETKVRPVLAEHCYSCHGPKKQNAGLRLDTAEGFRKGADAGPVAVAGDPTKSRLVKAIERKGDYPMPPSKPLPAAAVAALTEWVKQGGAYPNDAATDTRGTAANHWAFRPVLDPPVPNIKAKIDSTNAIDKFVYASLEAKGLEGAPRVSKETLIRRVYFDLIGIPPTYEEVQAFANDPARDAYERLVDRLLASPHFGERWGRHWLDLARYADSKGYVFTEDRTYPYAYTYRDYVIRAFNDDKPYNQFVVEQLAADRLPVNGDNHNLAAMGFLTVGRRFMNNTHDIIDDRIDVVTRGLMGLTVACARCHDHKYDPIPTADYYSLYGVFNGSTEPKDLPIIGEATAKETLAFEAELKQKTDAANAYATKMYADALAKFRTPEAVAAYLIAARDCRTMAGTQPDKLAADRKLDANMLGRWRDYLNADARKNDPSFAPWLAAWSVPDAEFATRGSKAIQDSLTASVPAVLVNALKVAKPATANDLAAVYGKVLSEAIKPLTATEKPDAERAKLAAILSGPDVPTNPTDPALANKFVAILVKKEYRLLRNAADKFKTTSPNAPPKAMVLAENANPPQQVVFLRGNPGNPGPKVPRQMPAIVAGPNRKPFATGSGRLELANAIASAENPLTARVYVNRVWGYLIGQGLVPTPSDFGVRTEPPTHPELLDWLAKRFVEDGWSTKKLMRRILVSSTYAQSSAATPKATQLDPENRLLAHMNRKRFDFEALRDGLLHVGGRLSPEVYGKSVDLFAKPFTTRRTVYGFVDRQNLAGTFRTFDFASPDQHTPQRFLTTVPQQALFLMNSPFVAVQAKAVIARPDVAFAFGPNDRVNRVYRAVLARPPTAEEAAMAREFVASVPTPESGKLTGWELLAQVLLLSNEFAFVD